jgi:rod shape-determining protein MreB
MVCDIGGGTTEIAVISSGGIVRAKSLRVGGDKFDQAIINYCKYRKDLIVGDTAAEMAKRQLAVATPDTNRGSMQIFGRNVRTGLATTQMITSGEVCQALRAPIEAIIRAIITTIEETPPEIAGDIFDFGIMLTGGGANIPGLAALISSQVGVRVIVAKHPTDAVCQGLGKFIEHPKLTSKQLIYRSR